MIELFGAKKQLEELREALAGLEAVLAQGADDTDTEQLLRYQSSLDKAIGKVQLATTEVVRKGKTQEAIELRTAAVDGAAAPAKDMMAGLLNPETDRIRAKL